MGYLNCPICEKTELSNVQELQQKIATALSKSHSCPICSADVYGLQAMHLHLATHIPIESGVITNKSRSVAETPTRNASGAILTSQDHIPSFERLDITDDRFPPLTLITQNHTLATINTTTSSGTEVLEMTKKEGPFQFNCDLCGLVFWSDHFLNLHKEIIHSKSKPFEVTCKQCKSRFKNLEAYRVHVKEAHSDRRYICDQCPKSFKVKGGLLVHTRMYHDQSTPSTCATCKKNFTSKARKELHDRRYHPAHASSIGDTKTLLANLLNTTSNVDNFPGRYVPKVHQKLGRQSSSPAVLIQNCLNVGEECRVTPSDVNSSCTLVKDYDMIVLTEPQPGNNNPSMFANSKSNERKNKCSTLDYESSFSNSDIKVVTPIHFATGPFGLISTNTLNSADEVCLNTNISQNLFDNLKPLSNFEFDLKKNCLQFGTINPNAEMNQLPFPKNNHKNYFETEGNNSGAFRSDNEACDGGFSFTQEFIQRNSLTNSFENSPPEKNFCIPSVESSPEHSVRQMKEALEELFMESPVSSPNEGLLSRREKISFSEGGTPPLQTTTDLITKKNFQLGRTSENKQWECDVCKKGFTTKYFLKKHKRLHTGETPYCCLECGKNFTFQQSYHKHVLYHSDDKPHICPHCGRAFKEMSTLHNHIRIHTGEKPFTCLTCGKSFRQRVSYLVHQRIHTGQMPYHCGTCNRSFRYKVSLRSHKCESVEGCELSNLVGTEQKISYDAEMLTTPEINASCPENQFQVAKIPEVRQNSVNPVEENLNNQTMASPNLRVATNNLIELPLLLSNSVQLRTCDDSSNSSAQNLRAVTETTGKINLVNNILQSQDNPEKNHLKAGSSYLHAVTGIYSESKDHRIEIFQCPEGGKLILPKETKNLIKNSSVLNEPSVSDCSVLKPYQSVKNKEPHCIFWYENQDYSRKDLMVNCNESGSVNQMQFEGEKDNLKSSINCEATQPSRPSCATDDDDDQASFLKSLFS